MKKLFFLLLIPVLGFGQATSFGNFKIVEQEIVYQKIFTQDSITVAKLETYYKALPFVTNVTSSADGLQFEVQDITIDYKKFEFTQVATPPIMQTGKYSGKVAVGVKEGRYRVTLSNIMVTGDIGYKKITTKEPLTSFACKNSGTILSQDWCRPNMLGLLDQALTDKFLFRKAKDDW
ncbi:MAG TPA: hypothetical protein VG737_01580 [Cyclobacteriaceae bacterium]|nr:hypothetical protein [Cyclobacteriaceae bacterium]